VPRCYRGYTVALLGIAAQLASVHHTKFAIAGVGWHPKTVSGSPNAH
jgi:hypothetical protein